MIIESCINSGIDDMSPHKGYGTITSWIWQWTTFSISMSPQTRRVFIFIDKSIESQLKWFLLHRANNWFLHNYWIKYNKLKIKWTPAEKKEKKEKKKKKKKKKERKKRKEKKTKTLILAHFGLFLALLAEFLESQQTFCWHSSKENHDGNFKPIGVETNRWI